MVGWVNLSSARRESTIRARHGPLARETSRHGLEARAIEAH
jgi:hypothetical protein